MPPSGYSPRTVSLRVSRMLNSSGNSAAKLAAGGGGGLTGGGPPAPPEAGGTVLPSPPVQGGGAVPPSPADPGPVPSVGGGPDFAGGTTGRGVSRSEDEVPES